MNGASFEQQFFSSLLRFWSRSFWCWVQFDLGDVIFQPYLRLHKRHRTSIDDNDEQAMGVESARPRALDAIEKKTAIFVNVHIFTRKQSC